MKILKVVIIRFNIRTTFAAFAKKERGVTNLDPTWLAKRFILFKKYCQPSLERQTDPNFLIFICFDKKTPKNYAAEICEDLRSIPIFADSLQDVIQKSNREILRQLRYTPRRGGIVVTTTRLDSDDAIAPRYMQAVEEFSANRTNRPDRSYVYFPLGQQYIEEKGKYKYYHYPANAFGTLIENWHPAGISTVYNRPHTMMVREEQSFPLYPTEIYWCIVIHDKNILNNERGVDMEVPAFRVD